jgi:hypothetical protein
MTVQLTYPAALRRPLLRCGDKGVYLSRAASERRYASMAKLRRKGA